MYQVVLFLVYLAALVEVVIDGMLMGVAVLVVVLVAVSGWYG